MGGKSGGGYSAAPMLEYGQQALDLQKSIYDDTVARSEPWYNAGVGAVDKLAMLMGINTAPTSADKSALSAKYAPQFTTQNNSNLIVGPDGRVVDVSGSPDEFSSRMLKMTGDHPSGAYAWDGILSGMSPEDRAKDFMSRGGFYAMGGGSSTDTAGLNSYVDDMIANGQSNASDPLFGSLAKPFTMSDYQEDPGYQFRLSEGNKALERQLAASGKSFTPAALKALSQYNQDMGAQEYGAAYNRFNNDQTNLFNRLAAVSGMGQTSNQTIAGTGQSYGDQASSIYGSMGNAAMEANAAKASSPSMFDKLLNAGVAGAQMYYGYGFGR